MMRRFFQNAAGMLLSLAARMAASTGWRHASQRASEGGILPPVGLRVLVFVKRSRDAAFTGSQGWLPPQGGGILPPARNEQS